MFDEKPVIIMVVLDLTTSHLAGARPGWIQKLKSNQRQISGEFVCG